jgi:hypothetical protein
MYTKAAATTPGHRSARVGDNGRPHNEPEPLWLAIDSRFRLTAFCRYSQHHNVKVIRLAEELTSSGKSDLDPTEPTSAMSCLKTAGRAW